MSADEIKINRLGEYLWEIPRTGGMRVPGRVYATEKLFSVLKEDNSLKQVMNVAHLPGIVGYSLAMPDIHWGYGFPIGGVAAMDVEQGVISPGGVGYDIDCGVRLVKTGLVFEEIKEKIPRIVEALFAAIPSGVGGEGAIPKLTKDAEKRLLRERGRRSRKRARPRARPQAGRHARVRESFSRDRPRRRDLPAAGRQHSGDLRRSGRRSVPQRLRQPPAL